MPCHTSDPTEEELNRYGDMSASQLEAVLCGIICAHGIEIVDTLDFAEVGVPHHLIVKWWSCHKKLDDTRKSGGV